MAYKNIEDKREYDRHRDPKKRKEEGRKYYINNREKRKEIDRQYQKNNRGKINKRNNNRRKTDFKIDLNHKMSSAIWQSLKGNKGGRHWESLVSHTLKDLELHLRKTIPEGYIWQDYIKGKLHIDHIIPISAFNFTRPEHIDFKRC